MPKRGKIRSLTATLLTLSLLLALCLILTAAHTGQTGTDFTLFVLPPALFFTVELLAEISRTAPVFARTPTPAAARPTLFQLPPPRQIA